MAYGPEVTQHGGMNPTRRRVAPVVPALALAAGALLLAACGTGAQTTASEPAAAPSSSAAAPSPQPSRTATEKGSSKDAAPAVAPGRYIDWADYDADPAAYADSRVVLFFHAPWCPNCRATEESLNADGVPDGLTIVKVDFDSQTDLRQEYGVTYQHTYVLVDTDGTALKKWTGTETGADIAAEAA